MNEEQTAVNNDFVLALAGMKRGRTLTECSQKMGRVIEGVRKTNKSGSISVTLTFTPSKDGERCEVSAKVTPKVPEPSVPPAMFYLTEDNRLVRDDPKQKEMAFAVVEGTKPEVKVEQAAVAKTA